MLFGQCHRLAAFPDVPAYPNNEVSLKKKSPFVIQLFKYNSIKINWPARYAGVVTGFKYTLQLLTHLFSYLNDRYKS